ncbi:MAG: hypothetical protein OEZ57_06490 [Nitrospirota bacterium]|nr:hypothetical protein [Nitrospirota bacterium]
MVHIATLKRLKTLLAVDPGHYVVHYGYQWDEVEEDDEAIRLLKLELLIHDPEKEELLITRASLPGFLPRYPPFASVAYCENPENIFFDPGILVATVDQEFYEAWKRAYPDSTQNPYTV